MDFKDPVRRHAGCFDRKMDYMQQGIELIAEVKSREDLEALHIPVETFEATLMELSYFRSRCHDLSAEQERAFDSKLADFVNSYRSLLRTLTRKN